METLRRCPFCGAEANLVKVRSGKNFRYAPGCTTDKCMGHWWVTGKGFFSEAEAIEAWNRRTDDGRNAEG